MLALTLLVLGIALADHASHTIALDNLAVLADRLHAGADFHGDTPVARKVGYGQTLTITGSATSCKCGPPLGLRSAEVLNYCRHRAARIRGTGDGPTDHHVARSGRPSRVRSHDTRLVVRRALRKADSGDDQR